MSDMVSIDFYETDLSVSGGKSASEAILASGKDYTAILCFSDVLALGAYFSLQEAGVRIPDDMSVMGFDNIDWSAHIVPPLTTIDLPAGEMGKSVAGELMHHLESGAPISPKQLHGQILERGSVSKT